MTVDVEMDLESDNLPSVRTGLGGIIKTPRRESTCRAASVNLRLLLGSHQQQAERVEP